jgi:hypothetical protein
MSILSARLLFFLLTGLLATACTGTNLISSWSNQNYKGPIKKVYIVGIAESDLNRMMFEDTFGDRLASEGVKVISSYIDLPKIQNIDREIIIQNMKDNGCDSILLTRLVGQRTVATSTGGQGSTRITPGPPVHNSAGFYSRGYYSSWNRYFTRSYNVTYNPPSNAKLVHLIVESVVYELKTEELIWAAQMETYLDENIEKMMQNFVNEVTKDLKKQGLI